MSRTACVLTRLFLLLLCLTLIGCGIGSTKTTQGATTTVFDEDGTRVDVPVPVTRIVSVNSGMTALIYALGAGDALIGRDAYSTFPSAARGVPAVAESSANCNLELIVSQEPQIVVADGMFYPQSEAKLAAAGIASYVDSTSDPERIATLIRTFGLILDRDKKAEELLAFFADNTAVIDQRIARLDLEGGEKPKVFIEWHSPYKTASAETSLNKPLVQAGGINIAAGQPVHTPVMSSEWIISQNPDVIVQRISGDATLELMKQKHAEILSRPGWDQINAVKNGRVYIIKADVFLTFRYPVGLAYYAKWFHPELFADLDPEAIHREAVTKFLGKAEWESLETLEAFVYPQ